MIKSEIIKGIEVFSCLPDAPSKRPPLLFIQLRPGPGQQHKQGRQAQQQACDRPDRGSHGGISTGST